MIAIATKQHVQINYKTQLKNELIERTIGRQKPLSLKNCQRRIMAILKQMDPDINAEDFTDNLMELVNHRFITTQMISIAVEGMLEDWGVNSLLQEWEIEEIESQLNN